LKIAIPNKGRLQQPSLQFLSSVGIKPLATDERSLIVPTSWEGVQPNLVENGAADIGITGMDYVIESRADVEDLIRLDFGKAKISLAVPLSWNISDVSELKREIKIATKYYNIAREYITRKNINAKIVKISGAAEVMPSLGAADAIIDVVSTGTTLKLHGLKEIDTVMETYATIIGNRYWLKSEEADKINLVLTMMKGALSARGKKMIFMNVKDKDLEKVLASLPAMLAPAISKLSKSDAWEVITVVNEDCLPEIVAKAMIAGAKDIVILGIEKVIR